jgi:hypothetical protein
MKLPYFKIMDAFSEARDSFSYGSGTDKLSAVAKLVGKSAANVGMLAAEAGVEIVKRAPETMGNMAKDHLKRNGHSMTDEQREAAQTLIQRGNDATERRVAKEREEEAERERDEQESRNQ